MSTTTPPSLPSSAFTAHAARASLRWGDSIDTVAPRMVESAAIASKAVTEYKGLRASSSSTSAPKLQKLDSQSALIVAPVPSQQRVQQKDGPALSRALQVRREHPEEIAAKPHLKWKLKRVIAGHLGIPLCVGVDASNAVFATGGADTTIKVWDLATGSLKITLASQHSHTVRSVQFSPRHAYLFSAGEDKRVRCFDLEYNKVVREYHGHTSAVYSMCLHPSLDLLVTGSRDTSVRVWDIRTRAQVHLLGGHKETVTALQSQSLDPQIISSSEDKTVRLWDLAAGKCNVTLTHHKKGVRALALHPTEFSFASGSTNSVKKFALPEGRFVHDFDAAGGIVNCLSVNRDGVLVGGSDDGELRFWDWGSAKPFQTMPILTQPGSLKSEAVCVASAFDMTGSRLITCNGDKSIHIYREMDAAES